MLKHLAGLIPYVKSTVSKVSGFVIKKLNSLNWKRLAAVVATIAQLVVTAVLTQPTKEKS